MNSEISPAVALIGTFAPLLVVTVIPGILASKLAKRKGYSGKYFFLGFFLSVIGLVFVAGLPAKKKDDPSDVKTEQ